VIRGSSIGSEERRGAALVLISRHERRLRGAARRFSLCADDADDAYQRAFEILLRKAPTDDPEQLLPWMLTVTKHEALAVRRNRERLLNGGPRNGESEDSSALDSLASDSIGPTEHVERRERVTRSREALKALKPQEVRALALRAQGYSYKEISELTGWSHTKVRWERRRLSKTPPGPRFRKSLSLHRPPQMTSEVSPASTTIAVDQAIAEAVIPRSRP
jgi:RNA polymerase sigma factor (sigma-70 family)